MILSPFKVSFDLLNWEGKVNSYYYLEMKGGILIDF